MTGYLFCFNLTLNLQKKIIYIRTKNKNIFKKNTNMVQIWGSNDEKTIRLLAEFCCVDDLKTSSKIVSTYKLRSIQPSASNLPSYNKI